MKSRPVAVAVAVGCHIQSLHNIGNSRMWISKPHNAIITVIIVIIIIAGRVIVRGVERMLSTTRFHNIKTRVVWFLDDGNCCRLILI